MLKILMIIGTVFVFDNGQLKYEIYFSNIIGYYKYRIFYYKTKILKVKYGRFNNFNERRTIGVDSDWF